MTETSTRYTFDRVVRMIVGAITIVAVIWLLRYLSDVLIPFAAAVILAYLLNPLVNIFESRTQRRWLAVLMTIGGLLIIGTAIIALLVPVTYWQFQRIARDIGKLRDDVVGSWQFEARASESDSSHIAEVSLERSQAETATPETTVELKVTTTGDATTPDQSALIVTTNDESKSRIGWYEFLQGWERYRRDAHVDPPLMRGERLRNLREAIRGTFIGTASDEVIKYVKQRRYADWLPNILAQAANIGLGAGATVVGFFVSIVVGLAVIIIVLVYLIFLLMDFPEYARTWHSLLPPGVRSTLVEFITEFDAAMRQYFRGQSVVAIFTAALYAVGFTIIGLPLGVPLAVVIGVLSMVPYLASIAIIPGYLLAIIRSVEGDSSLLASFALVTLIFFVVQLIQDWVITPRVMGKATGLKPIAILLGVFIWGKLLGFLGILLAIPLTCLFIAYYRRYVLKQTRNVSVVPAT